MEPQTETLLHQLNRYRLRAEILEQEGYYDLARDLRTKAEDCLRRLGSLPRAPELATD